MINLLNLEIKLSKKKDEIIDICDEVVKYLPCADSIILLENIPEILDTMEKLLVKYVEELEVQYNGRNKSESVND